jgi:eukaryotic-like serine/threonine-protein kinase
VSDDARWSQLRREFDDLVDAAADTRAARLAEVGRADAGLRAELDALLAADASVDDRLARVEALLGSAELVREPTVDTLSLVGSTVGHFRVVAPLASGGMGVVYRAHDTHLGRAVALKFPLPHQRADLDVAERFRREARAAAALDHPNICSVYEVGETADGRIFLAMPLYEGETLRARLARERCLPLVTAVNIAARLAAGLAAAHRANVIHRDLKPANIMLLDDDGVKILDFGLARMTGALLTRSTRQLGTIAYMAPEQVRGEHSDARSDLWALGVVLYEMLTGERPFDREHDVAVMHAILHTAPVRPRLLRADVPQGLEDIVVRLLTVDRAGRFASADDVVAALAALDLPARDGAPAAPRSRPARRWRSTVLLMAALAVPLAGVAGWLVHDSGAAEGAPVVVAVLPFDESDAGDDAYLGRALADALATGLARLPGVVVRDGRALSNHEHAGRGADELARNLGVTALVTGAVEHHGGGPRVSLTVHDTRSGQNATRVHDIPAGQFRELHVQLVRGAADALRVRILRAERARLAVQPTVSEAAWELYLRGRAADMPTTANARTAIPQLQQAQSYYVMAREREPDFALARARLAMVHLQLAVRHDTTRARRDQARLEAEAAVRAAPQLPEAHHALAMYWSMAGDPVRSADQLRHAVTAAPFRADLWLARAVRLREVGQWEEAAADMERAIELDPRNSAILMRAAETYGRMRRYRDAIAGYDRVIALDSTDLMVQLIRGYSYQRLGILDSLAATVDRIPAAEDGGGNVTWARLVVLRGQHRHVEALAMLDRARHPLVNDGLLYRPLSLLRAMVLDGLGDSASARTHYDAARVLLEDSSAAYPQNGPIRAALGLAYAGLGRRDDALREARTAMQLAQLSEAHMLATALMGLAVEVFIRAGAHDEALELMELLLSIPAGREISVPLLRIEPMFDPLRSDPRFDELVRRYSRALTSSSASAAQQNVAQRAGVRGAAS